MISCVVLVFLGANRSIDEKTSLKLFSGAAPDKCSLCNDPPLVKSRRAAMRGGEHRSRSHPDKSYFDFFAFFFKFPENHPNLLQIILPRPARFRQKSADGCPFFLSQRSVPSMTFLRGGTRSNQSAQGTTGLSCLRVRLRRSNSSRSCFRSCRETSTLRLE